MNVHDSDTVHREWLACPAEATRVRSTLELNGSTIARNAKTELANSNMPASPNSFRIGQATWQAPHAGLYRGAKAGIAKADGALSQRAAHSRARGQHTRHLVASSLSPFPVPSTHAADMDDAMMASRPALRRSRRCKRMAPFILTILIAAKSSPEFHIYWQPQLHRPCRGAAPRRPALPWYARGAYGFAVNGRAAEWKSQVGQSATDSVRSMSEFAARREQHIRGVRPGRRQRS